MIKTRLARKTERRAAARTSRLLILILSAYAFIVVPGPDASFAAPAARTPSPGASGPGNEPGRKDEIKEIATSIASAEFVTAEYLGGDFQSSIQLSPDGRWVAYIVSTGSVSRNERQEAYRIRKTDGTGREILLPANATNPQFSPDGSMLALALPSRNSRSRQHLRRVIYSFHEGALSEIRRQPITSQFNGSSGEPAAGVPWSYKWSPDSRKIALNVVASGDSNRSPADHGTSRMREWRANGALNAMSSDWQHDASQRTTCATARSARTVARRPILRLRLVSRQSPIGDRDLHVTQTIKPTGFRVGDLQRQLKARSGSLPIRAELQCRRPDFGRQPEQGFCLSVPGRNEADYHEGRPAVLDLGSGKVRYYHRGASRPCSSLGGQWKVVHLVI